MCVNTYRLRFFDYLNPYWVNKIHVKRRPLVLRHRARIGAYYCIKSRVRLENIQLLNRDYRHAPVAIFN